MESIQAIAAILTGLGLTLRGAAMLVAALARSQRQRKPTRPA